MPLTTKAGFIARTGRALIFASLVTCMQAHSAAINTGVEQILWPVAIIASPFILVHNLLFGSDSSAKKSAESEAAKILARHTSQIPANGLYTGAISLRWALYGMLVERQLPFIEVDTAGSAWLLSLTDTPETYIAQAQQHKYIRLSFGDHDDPHCIHWASSVDKWTDGPPVRPGTCVLAVFDDTLQSQLQLSVNTSKVRHRKLQWELIDRATGSPLISVPFWAYQTEGEPLQFYAIYRAAIEDSTFIRVLKKLSPSAAPRNKDGLPFVMNHSDDAKLRRWPSTDATGVTGEFRSVTPDSPKVAKRKENERWQEGYERAMATGLPVIINNFLLVAPKDDMVRKACIDPISSNLCNSAYNFVSDFSVLSVRTEGAYLDTETSPAPGRRSLTRQMYMEAMSRTWDGQFRWFVRVTPSALPQPLERCMDFKLGCYFFPTQATSTNRELVIRGVFGANRNRGTPIPKEEYELVVPLNQLPPITTAQ